MDIEWKQIIAGTMDTEATMISLGRKLKVKCAENGGDADFNGCVDHILELTTGLAFENTPHSEDVMKKCRKHVTHFNESSQANAILLKKQEGGAGRPVYCIQDVVTRWWSTYSMGQRLLRLRPYIQIMVGERSLPADLNLTDSQWAILQDTLTLLEPFMVAQRVLEGEKYVTISLVLVIIMKIREKLVAAIASVNSTDHVKTLATTLLNNFNVHWGSGCPGTV